MLAVLALRESLSGAQLVSGALLFVSVWLKLAKKHAHANEHKETKHTHHHGHGDLHHEHHGGAQEKPHAHLHKHAAVSHAHGRTRTTASATSPRPGRGKGPTVATSIHGKSSAGAPLMLFAWLPVIGDTFCLAADWARLNWAAVALFCDAGRFLRYWLVANGVPFQF